MKILAQAVFWLSVFLVFLTPMELGDVWWHLSSGRWIAENFAFPESDPFSFTEEAAGAKFVLRGFWLCQVLLYGIHRIFGVHGLVALKALLFTLTAFVLHRTTEERGLAPPLSHALVLPAVFIAAYYDEMRPQTFSFLFFALTLHILEDSRAGGKPPERLFFGRQWLLPTLMLLWANMHPGFSIGVALISAYLAESLARAAFGRPLNKGFVLACAAAVGVSALNPNGLDAVLRTAQAVLASVKGGSPGIHEHLPMKEFSSFTGQTYLYPAIVAFAALGLASFLLSIRRPDVLRLAVFLALALVSVRNFRAGFFLAIAGVQAIAGNLSGVLGPRRPGGSRAAAALAAALVLFTALLLWPRTVFKKPAVNPRLIPVKAAAFIEEASPPPNLYHPYEWGGYLTWRLHPAYRVFIDGRAIGPRAEYAEVFSAGPRWKEILDKYNVNTAAFWAIQPFGGEVPPVVFALLSDEGWEPAYWDLQSVVFTRAGMEERPVRRRAVWELLVSLASAGVMRAPSDPGRHAVLGEVYLRRGLPSEAVKSFEKALALDPENKKAAFWLAALRTGGGPP